VCDGGNFETVVEKAALEDAPANGTTAHAV
jgi:hypothetical protein